MALIEGLSEREQQVREHLQKAQELGSTLVEYAAAFGLDVKELYAVKQQLVKKGVLAGKNKSEATEMSTAFVPVRALQPATTAAEIACRLVHPSGWKIECAELPDAQWIAQLLHPATSS